MILHHTPDNRHNSPRLIAPATGAPSGVAGCPHGTMPSYMPATMPFDPTVLPVRVWTLVAADRLPATGPVQGQGQGRSAPIARRWTG